MRALTTLAVTALVALAAGCGGDDSSDDTTTTAARGYGDDAAAVTSTIEDYFAALASGDGEKACAFFTDDAIAKIEAGAGGDCASTVTAGVKATGTEPYEDADLDEPAVDGDSATVHYSLKVKDQTVEADQTLTKVGDEWKLEAATPPTSGG